MEIKTMTVEELEGRKSAIIAELDAPEANLDALEAEARSINEELETRKAEETQRVEERKAVINGDCEDIITKIEVNEMDERTFGIESVEYRNAWLKSLQHKELNEVEQRAYASNDAHNAIPTLVADKMFEKMVKVAPMLSEITLLRAAGNLKFVTEGVRNSAYNHTQNSVEAASADTVVTVTLGAVEFMKVIQISRSAEAMSVDAFEAWLVKMLAEDVARQIDNYIINGGSDGIADITFTTGSNQILNTATTGYTYKNICDLIALLPAGYDGGAKFLAHKATIWNKLATITNSSGTPIFVPDTREGVAGRLMGYDVLVDDYVGTSKSELYLGDFSQVVGNLSQDIMVDRDESAGFTSNSIMYRGTANFDAAVANKEAFVRLVATV